MSRFLDRQPNDPPSGRRRSVYEDRGGFESDTDPDTVEPGWVRIGELDPSTGRWLDPPNLYRPFGGGRTDG